MKPPVFSVAYVEEYEIDPISGTIADFVFRMRLLSDTGDRLAVEIHSDCLADIADRISSAMRRNNSSARQQ